ncbi:YibE/F family protein [Bariatricus sp. SGI.154]|uniref:YibE/F family protein n=1 Tax=Bariatricus sp. SGI.154 TaxID=3420549 RepID=UPI003CFF227B
MVLQEMRLDGAKLQKKLRDFVKTYQWQTCLFIVMAIVVIVTFCNASLYPSEIGKVVKVQTEQSGDMVNYNSEMENISEPYYVQKLTIKILNGQYKGKKVTVSNEFGYSEVDTERYQKGDRVFLRISGEEQISSVSITGVKRDQYAILLAVILIFLVIILGKGRGVLSLCSIGVNIVVFVYGLVRYEEGDDLLKICAVMIVIFTVGTLFLVNGVNKRSLVAIISALVTVVITMSIFLLAMNYGEEIDYAALDYIVGNQELETIFIASIAIAGLGAIMDVSVSIAAALQELIMRKPDITFRALVHSGREIGYDIMGTMMNVLLFTYICGLIPLMLIKMKNEISLITIIRLQIPFEICRFLIGSIGIVMAIPVSIGIASIVMKMGRRRA